MPRPTSRCRLESGIKLDLNRLARRGFIKPGAATGPVVIRWENYYWGELLGVISSDMSDTYEGWFRIQIGDDLDQRIHLAARQRHFGGRQWYFICPYKFRRVSVLWMPPGAHSFACRQRWGRAVAYNSQCSTLVDRAHQGKARINSRLCSVGGFDPEDWDFPPKPKWMRWSTYKRAEEQFDCYEKALDIGCWRAAMKLIGIK